jgi:hypothetical protein
MYRYSIFYDILSPIFMILLRNTRKNSFKVWIEYLYSNKFHWDYFIVKVLSLSGLLILSYDYGKSMFFCTDHIHWKVAMFSCQNRNNRKIWSFQNRPISMILFLCGLWIRNSKLNFSSILETDHDIGTTNSVKSKYPDSNTLAARTLCKVFIAH